MLSELDEAKLRDVARQFEDGLLAPVNAFFIVFDVLIPLEGESLIEGIKLVPPYLVGRFVAMNENNDQRDVVRVVNAMRTLRNK